MSVAITDAGGDYGAVIVSGVNLALGEEDARAAEALLAGTAVLVLQNEVPDAANVAVARLARAAGARVLLNAAPARPLSAELAALTDILVVNAIEAEMLAGIPPFDGLADALAAARRLAGTFPVAVVTAGGAGVAYAERNGAHAAIPGIPVAVVSTHGAGDEFVGFLAAALAGRAPLEAALRGANEAAARLVSTPKGE
jgi:ribokinase